MNIHNHRQRIAFLNLRVRLGMASDAERAELKRLASIRMVATTAGAIILEPLPMTPEAWKTHVATRNAQLRELREHENT